MFPAKPKATILSKPEFIAENTKCPTSRAEDHCTGNYTALTESYQQAASLCSFLLQETVKFISKTFPIQTQLSPEFQPSHWSKYPYEQSQICPRTELARNSVKDD